MPPFVRQLVVLLIALPGTLLWLVGALGTMFSGAFLIMGRLDLGESAMVPASLAAALTGHVMYSFSGNLLGEAEQRMGASQIGERLAWDAAFDVLGLGLVAAGVALAPSVGGGEWGHALTAFTLLVVLSPALALVRRRRGAFLDRWQQENAPPEGADAIPGIDSLQAPSQGDRAGRL